MSEASGLDGSEVGVGLKDAGGGLGLETVYLVVILACRMGSGQKTMVQQGEKRTYGGRSRRYKEAGLFQI